MFTKKKKKKKKAFPKDIKSYDPNDSAWPGKLDEFAEVRQGRRKKNKMFFFVLIIIFD